MDVKEMLDLADLQGEIWKPVTGYEGIYNVSNLGRVKTLTRDITYGVKYSNTITIHEKIISHTKDRNGYPCVRLSKNFKKAKTVKVHRMVAEAFCENPKGNKIVNHKNGIKNDNRAENLEWTTLSGNRIHAINTGLVTFKVGKECDGAKPVYQYKLDGTYVGEYESIGCAARANNVRITYISKACNNSQHGSCGFVWSFHKLTPDEIVNRNFFGKRPKVTLRPVIMYDLEGNEVSRFSSIKEAETLTGAYYSNISACCKGKIKTCNGHTWKFASDVEASIAM